jgi:hypothetical protein
VSKQTALSTVSAVDYFRDYGMYMDEPETPSGAAAETNGDADQAETNGDADQADTEMAHAEASGDEPVKLEEQVQPTSNDM